MIFLILSLTIDISGDSYNLEEYTFNNIGYINSQTLIEKLDFSSHWKSNLQTLTIQKEKIVYLTQDNPFIKIEKNIYQIKNPPLMRKGAIYIPVRALPLIVGKLLNMEAEFQNDVLRIGTRVNVYRTSIDAGNSYTNWTVNCSPTLKYLFNRANGKWVLTIFNPVYHQNILNQNPEGLIEEIEAEEGNGFLKFRFKTKDDLPMDISRKGDKLTVKVQKFEKRGIKTIVVDPGHGGKDPGATYLGVREKDIVLKLSKKIAADLTERGFNVIMTRVEDEFLPLKERTEIADSARADLFISVHCNAAPNASRKMHGAETYFLSAAKSDWARTVEATENSAIRFEVEEDKDVSELDYILNDLAQTQFLEESQQAGIYIQESIIHNCKLYNRGVKQANFYVLRLNYMPAVLVEAAFLTNSADRTKLQDEEFLEKIAEAIAEGVQEYADSHT